MCRRESKYRAGRKEMTDEKEMGFNVDVVYGRLVIVMWYGATNFIADNDTAEGRAKNRRVEIAIGMLE